MSKQHPIVIEDIDDDVVMQNDFAQTRPIFDPSPNDEDQVMSDAPKDHSSNEDVDEDDLEVLGDAARSINSVEVPVGSKRLPSLLHCGFMLRPHTTIQYQYEESHEDYANDDLGARFLCITDILRSPDGAVFLKGWSLRKASSLKGMLPNKANELVILMPLADNGQDTDLRACSTTLLLPPQCWEREVIFTNVLQPTQRERNRLYRNMDKRDLSQYGTLYCRWINIFKVNPVTGRFAELVLRRLELKECSYHGVSDDSLRDDWRRTRGRTRDYATSDDHKYTAADIFTGGGLISIGLYNAGLRLKYGIDNSKEAVETLKANSLYDEGEIHCIDIHQWVTGRSGRRYLVSVLHLSPPCQAFSPANSGGGRNDMKNISTNMCITESLVLHRPRIATLEQTEGLKRVKWTEYYHKVVAQFTTVNYSVRIRAVNLSEYGNPHARKRLIVIASCPGEPLPTHPEPTHGPGRLPFCTIDDVQRGLRGYAPPAHMMQHSRKTGNAFPTNQRYPRCIMASSVGLHWSGTRGLMLYEAAALQTVPTWYEFVGSRKAIQTQIGNGVPPVYGQKLFSHIVEHLRREDRQIARRLAQ